MFKCTDCWYLSAKWSGKCLNCGSWNTLTETEDNSKKWIKTTKWKQKDVFGIIETKESTQRLELKSSELNNVLWWWIVPWSLLLLSWEPGIGKSTLSLQIANWFATSDRFSLYVSSEENIYQLSDRAKRLNIKNENIQILNSSNLEDISETIENSKTDLIIVDSISIIYSWDLTSTSWSVSQIKYIAERFMEIAKRTKKAIILIWHVTKDWTISWPKILEHLVDTVLFLEWSKYENYRIVRSLKNRFWPTDEIGLFIMTNEWMQDLKNPWVEFINAENEKLSGSALTMTVEWNRPILVEIEALTTYTKFWYPKRSCRWISSGKLDLLIAIINKFTNTKLESYDVYVNVARGFNISEPWVDLSTIASIISSKKWKPLWKSIFIWEVSLTWVVKKVFNIEKRIDETIKLGFEKIIIPYWIDKIKNKKWQIMEIKNIKELEDRIDREF